MDKMYFYTTYFARETRSDFVDYFFKHKNKSTLLK